MSLRVASLALLWAASPGPALACSVCQGGTSDNRIEFILTTAFLTFLPLLLIGGVVYGLRRRYLRVAQQVVRDDAPRVEPRAPAAPHASR